MGLWSTCPGAPDSLRPEAERIHMNWTGAQCVIRGTWTWTIHNHKQYASNNLNKITTGSFHHFHNFHTSSGSVNLLNLLLYCDKMTNQMIIHFCWLLLQKNYLYSSFRNFSFMIITLKISLISLFYTCGFCATGSCCPLIQIWDFTWLNC